MRLRRHRALRLALRARNGERRTATVTDRRMMRTALRLAQKAADEGEVPVGAVVYRGDGDDAEILAEAHNTREARRDPAGHAEITVIAAAAKRIGDWRLTECTLVVTLEPCIMCAGAIVNARLGRLVYGAHDPKAGAVASLYRLCEDQRLNHRITPIGGLMARHASAQLKAFFRERRRVRKQERQAERS
ncbi:MAG: tRNA adenosine(34) deaminase TadA [Phycisphaerales bacterium]|nr:tRNA adenosine(34) deaminase TadA [Phycisphaerales bacterium]